PESVDDDVVVESLAPDVVPPYEPTVLVLPGEDDDWMPSAVELEESLVAIRRLRRNIRNAEAHITLCMGQAAYQISSAVAHARGIRESPAGVWKEAPELGIPLIESWLKQARKWEEILRRSKLMLSQFAPTIYRYESDKKRKAEVSSRTDLPDDETRKYIFRQVEHENDYGWGKRARVDEGFLSAVTQLSMSAVQASEPPNAESSKPIVVKTEEL
ncbi:hypothetical protein BGZ79_004432, partial [Entomortierella chlamydospora]